MADEATTRIEGVDEIDALFYAVPLALVGNAVLYAALRTADPALGSIGVGLLLLALCAWMGRRYRCTISPSGIRLVRYAFFVVPLQRDEFLLDAEIRLYEPWECTSPQGLEIGRSGCFGPYSSESTQRALLEEMRGALEAARRAAPSPPDHLRCPQLEEQIPRLRITERTPQGIIKRAVAEQPLDIHGIGIPEGSELVFNRDPFERGWRDPRRDDELSHIECSDEVTLPTGHTVQPGAHLWIANYPYSFSLQNGFEGVVELDGLRIDGNAHITFHADGTLKSYTLSEDVDVDGVTIPSNSAVWHLPDWPLRPQISITLGAPTFVRGRRFRKGDLLRFVPPALPGIRSTRLRLRETRLDTA